MPKIPQGRWKNGEECFVIRCVHDLHPLSMRRGPPPSHHPSIPEQTFDMATLSYQSIPKQQKDCLHKPSDPGDTYLTSLNKPSNPIKSDHIQALISALPPTALATTPPNYLVVAVPQKQNQISKSVDAPILTQLSFHLSRPKGPFPFVAALLALTCEAEHSECNQRMIPCENYSTLLQKDNRLL